MSDRQRCNATKKSGEPCMGFALPGKDTCLAHSQTAEERRASALHASRARASHRARRKEAVEAFAGFRPGITPQEVCKRLAPSLNATYADAGLPDQADWETRTFALIALLNAFPRELWTTPAHAKRVLEETMPEAVRQTAERFDAVRDYKEMRRALINSRIRLSVFGELYIAPLPDWAFAPWESREEVMRSEAPNLTHTKPIRALDGTMLLERTDEPGIVDVVQVDAA